MAQSPFDWFRKHTGLLMVVLCAMLMLAFIVGEPLMQWMNSAMGGPGSGRRAKEVAVTWPGGDLTERDLSGLVMKRQVLTNFISSVHREGSLKATEEGLPPNMPTTVAPLLLPTTREDNVEQSVVRSRIFAKAAREAGMVVGDEMIHEYLEQLGRDRVSSSRMKEIIKNMQVGRGGGVSVGFVFDILRDELLARSYSSSYAYSRAMLTPLENWESWLKANDRVAIESVALPAADFLKDTPEPTEEEIKEYFDKYKKALPGDVSVQNTRLPSPTPAFQSPDMAQLQFVKASFLDAKEETEGEVTDEEIAKYYEENREYFPKSDLDLSEDDQQTTDESQADESQADGAPADEDQAEPAADKQEEEAAAAEPDEADSSSVLPSTPFRLVATEVEADEAEDATEAENATEANDATDAEESAQADTPGSAIDEFMNEADEPEGEPDAGEVPSDSDSSVEDQEEEVEYQTLEEATEAIREQLARQKAADMLRTRLNELRDILLGDYDIYVTKRIIAEAEERAIPTPPAALADFEKLAKDNSLEYGQGELLPLKELNETTAGKLIQPDDQLGQYMPISIQALRPNGLELFEPSIAADTDQNLYLVMKIKHVKQSTPKLDEVRDKVISAWKNEKAAELALERAKELAKQATDAGDSLDELFAGRPSAEVVESELFSWLTPSIAPRGVYLLKLDNPGTVEHAGPEFLEAVFGLEPNEVGAAMDHDKTHAYVFRVVQRENSQQELREQFLRSWNRWEGLRNVQQTHIRQADRAVYKSVLGGELPDWQRTPDADPEDA